MGLSSPFKEGLMGPRFASHWGSQAQAHLTHWQPSSLRAGHTPPSAHAEGGVGEVGGRGGGTVFLGILIEQ